MSTSMLHIHIHAVCQCLFSSCKSSSVPNVHIYCSCCMLMSTQYVHVNAACPCAYVACPNPCSTSMSMQHIHVHGTCPCT
jgi:hypothetical protein